MSDLVWGLLVVAVAAIAVGFGALTRRLRAPQQPPVDVSWAGDETPLVAFTSTDCSNCARVLAALDEVGAPVREIPFEHEPELFERSGVDGVPLVVVLGRGGRPNWQRGGIVKPGTVRRALARAGW